MKSIYSKVLLTGKKRSGKDTVANRIAIRYNFKKLSLAEPIKRCSYEIFPGWKYMKDSNKGKIDITYGISPRQFWQAFGTDFMQILLCKNYKEYEKITGRSFWTKYLINRIWNENLKKVVVSDVRFPHEVDLFKEEFNDVLVVRINRNLNNNDEHPSEKEMDTIKPDITISNNKDLTNLSQQIDIMFDNILM